MIISLGVIDLPYDDEKGVTTGDVAEILESEYGVMASFVDLHEADILDAVENALVGHMENMMLGAPPTDSPLAGAASTIEKEFRNYLDAEEMSQVAGIAGHSAGVPTKAALKGVSKRFKRKRGARRPSFIDSGMYQASFHVEVKS